MSPAEIRFLPLSLTSHPPPLQLRNKLNQDQTVRLLQHRDSLNKRNLEVAAMDRRLAELRQRLWKKKAALQQKENLPVRTCWNLQQNFIQELTDTNQSHCVCVFVPSSYLAF